MDAIQEKDALMKQGTILCPDCKALSNTDIFFCPNCGKQLKEKPFQTTVEAQLKIYLFSILVPPFGVIPGYKYLIQKDSKSQMIGIITLILTFVSFGFTIYYLLQFMDEFNKEFTKALQMIR